MYKYLLFFILLSCNSSNDNAVKQATPQINTPAVLDTLQKTNNVTKQATLVATALTLSKDFSENEVAANKKYKDSIIKITGTIKQINVGINDKAYIILTGTDKFTEPFCYLTDIKDAEKLKIGEKITIVGKCIGLWANLIFTNCKVIF